jgi:HAE1 family hydrophobic/amphiphilic exporter-1
VNLPELSIRRHVLAYMLSGVLVLFGVVSFERIGVDRYPAIDFPIISVTTALPGASPEVIDSSLTSVLETAINGVPGIEHVLSSSAAGVSVVAVQFVLEKNADVAFNEVQAKVNQVLPQLPAEAEPPVVAKLEFGAMPVLWLALTGDRTLQQLNQYARNVIKKRLETVDGVAEVRLGGKRERTIRVDLDPGRLAQFGVTVGDVVRAFRAEHVRLPGGFLVGEDQEELIKLDLEYHDARALAGMLIAYREGAPIRLGDVATVEDGIADFRQLARFDGREAVGIGLVKVQNANTVAIVEEVRRRLAAEIVPQLPPGMAIAIAHDEADLIANIVAALEEHIVLGTLLTALVVWVFLKSLRSTLIIAAAIPVSLLGAVAVMYFAGFTFNTMTLLALLLLIGVVVDDAIVVLENVFRHREALGADPVIAALDGTRQVVFAVIAASLTLVSIFAPVIFMQGIIGRFFQSFAVVVTFGVLVSLFVSLTLTPMLCARHLIVRADHGRLYRLLDRPFRALDAGYRRVLGWALGWRWTVVAVTVAVVYSSGYFFDRIGKGFLPAQDEGRFVVTVKAPLGASIEYTARKLGEVEAVLARHPEVASSFSTVGLDRTGQVSIAEVIVRMVPWEARALSQEALIERVREGLAEIPGAEAYPTPMPLMSGERGEPLQFVLTGPDLWEVARLAGELKARLAEVEGLGPLDLDLQVDLPQLDLVVQRERVARLGLTSQDVALAVNVLAGGLDVARYNDASGDSERYDIRLKASPGALAYAPDLSQIYLRGADGDLVRLDNLARLEPRLGPAVVSRYDLHYSARFLGTPTLAEAEAIARVEAVAADLMPAGYRVQMTGRSEEFGKTARYMLFAFVTALVLVYMVLASQFNSFLQPLVIMVAQPLAIIGGVGALWLTGHSLNIYSMIGLVLLVGLVAKNSILLVDLANQLRVAGSGIREALEEACPVRMRPVLMTSLTIILALLPAALGYGAGADTNGPLAVAVLGGMVSSTLLTLVVVPAVYSLVEGGVVRLARLRAIVGFGSQSASGGGGGGRPRGGGGTREGACSPGGGGGRAAYPRVPE